MMDVSADDGDWRLAVRKVMRLPAAMGKIRVGLVGLGYDGTTVIYSERGEDNIRGGTSHWRAVWPRRSCRMNTSTAYTGRAPAI